MESVYEKFPNCQIEAQKKFLYGSIINLLYMRENNDPFLKNRIQSLINVIAGSNELFAYQPEVLTIVSCLEVAKKCDDQFRKAVLDAANMVDTLKGGDCVV